MSRGLGELELPLQVVNLPKVALESAHGALGLSFWIRSTAHLPPKLLIPKMTTGLWRSPHSPSRIAMVHQSRYKWVLGVISLCDCLKSLSGLTLVFDSLFKSTIWAKEQRNVLMSSILHIRFALRICIFSLTHRHTWTLNSGPEDKVEM